MKGFRVKQERKVPPPSHRDPLRPRLGQTSTDGRNVFSSLRVQTVWSRTKCLQNSTYFNGSTGKRGDCIKEETELGGLPSITPTKPELTTASLPGTSVQGPRALICLS